MFKKNATPSDVVKKSQQKCVDAKRDTPTRLKHLRIVLENCDLAEIKAFLDVHHSPVFYTFFDAFILFETNLRQKGFSVQRPHREDLELSLWVLERLLCLLPQLFAQRWQCNALTHIFRKLLHPSNTLRLRKEGIRLFIIWYMIVADNKTPDMDAMFASLVPGFPAPPPRAVITGGGPDAAKVVPVEPQPIIPASATDKMPDDVTAYLLHSLLDFMVTEVHRVEWRNKAQSRAAFSFLFTMFRAVYLPYIFPSFNPNNSIYCPNLELPELRSSPGKSLFGTCQVVMVRWVRQYVSSTAPVPTPRPSSTAPSHAHHAIRGGGSLDEDRRVSEAPHQEGGSLSDQDSVSSAGLTNEAQAAEEARLVRETLLSSRSNIDFIHEVFRQALCLSFRYSEAIRLVIMCYRDWIQMSAELPVFLQEPDEVTPEDEVGPGPGYRRASRDSQTVGTRDSDVRAGLQNVLQVFVTSAANVFLLQVSPDYPLLLDEQVELCKHVLNTYRYMVMNTRMERRTWEQLLIVLFHITSQILSGKHVKPKEDSLGGRFASALFQTLIVSWIKANLSVVVSGVLWDQLLSTLSSLSNWEELVKEWAKTLETLTRVLARHVYGLEVNSLPLDRVNERRAIKRGSRANTSLRGGTAGVGTFGRGWSSMRPAISPEQPEARGAAMPQLPEDGSLLGSDQGPRCRMNSAGSSQRGATHYHNQPHHHAHGVQDGSNAGAIGVSAADHHQQHPHHHQDIFCPHRYYNNHHHHHFHHNCLRRIVRALSDSNLYFRKVYGEFSRSPSPSPSSGMESSSMKDSPMQLDFGGDNVSIDTCEGLSSEQHSVMAGGSVRGWLPDVAVVLWKRVLGLLGDPNTVASPHIHAQIFAHLSELSTTLIKLRENQGISTDNLSTPGPPELVPPITLIAPWCFKALSLPSSHQRGKVTAYRLLCTMLVRRHDAVPARDLISAFFSVLHNGLVSSDQEVINTLIGACGPYFFSLGLPGSTMLALDFIYAANTVVAAPDAKQGSVFPREEAISLLGSLLPLVTQSTSLPVLQPQPNTFTLMNCSDVKDHVLTVLLKSSKKDGYWRTRALALCALSCSIYHQLSDPPPHNRLQDVINVLLAALRPPTPSGPQKQISYAAAQIGRLVGQVAADLLMLLADHADTLVDFYPDIPPRIIQVLCQTLSVLGGSGSVGSSSTASCEDQHLILSVLFCLAEWVMKLPQQDLVTPTQVDGVPILRHVFKVLHIVHTGGHIGTVLSKAPPVVVPDFSCTVREDTSPRDPRADTLKRHSGLAPSVITTVRLAAKAVSQHLINHLWHFPLACGAQRLSSLVVESDDLPGQASTSTVGLGVGAEELTGDVFLSPHVQLFTLNGDSLLSMVQLPALHGPGGGIAGFSTPSSEVRLIIRNLSGKFSWDVSMLCTPPEDPVDCSSFPSFDEAINTENDMTSAAARHHSSSLGSGLTAQNLLLTSDIQNASAVQHELSSSRDDLMSSSMLAAPQAALRHTLRCRDPGTLPTFQDSAHDLDNLDDLLSYIGYTSPEVLEGTYGGVLNESSPPPASLPLTLQHDAITTTLGHRNQQQDFLAHHAQNMSCPEEECPVLREEASPPFHQCRLLFDQLGLASWDKRGSINLLQKNEKLLRELKNLDNQKCRETHKIAVLYVAEGQEDKLSILSNSGGSDRFEEFVGGLGWEVELSSHTGFLGGLHRNGSTGETAPYYATSLTEVIFHVSTRMPSHSEQCLLSKTRHLGNDEVHIVWSEHTRDYRRGILPTEFCDVLIVVYPLPNRLHRIQISSKPDVPFFGPLFDGAMVGRHELPLLVRATAINASRAKRSRLPLYQNFYEERDRALKTLIEAFSEQTTFENFASAVFCPVFPASFSSFLTSEFTTRGAEVLVGDAKVTAPGSSNVMFYPAESSSGMAAALLLESGGVCSSCGGSTCRCSPQQQRPPLIRPTSYSTGEHHNLREKARTPTSEKRVSGDGADIIATVVRKWSAGQKEGASLFYHSLTEQQSALYASRNVEILEPYNKVCICFDTCRHTDDELAKPELAVFKRRRVYSSKLSDLERCNKDFYRDRVCFCIWCHDVKDPLLSRKNSTVPSKPACMSSMEEWGGDVIQPPVFNVGLTHCSWSVDCLDDLEIGSVRPDLSSPMRERQQSMDWRATESCNDWRGHRHSESQLNVAGKVSALLPGMVKRRRKLTLPNLSLFHSDTATGSGGSQRQTSSATPPTSSSSPAGAGNGGQEGVVLGSSTVPSPRANKKMSFKAPHRRVSSHQQILPGAAVGGKQMPSHPESPLPPPRKVKETQPVSKAGQRHSVQQQVIQQQQRGK